MRGLGSLGAGVMLAAASMAAGAPLDPLDDQRRRADHELGGKRKTRRGAIVLRLPAGPVEHVVTPEPLGKRAKRRRKGKRS